MVLDETTQREIVARVLGAASPSKTFLFGSAASGEMGSDSDIDLLVIMREAENPRRQSAKYAASFAAYHSHSTYSSGLKSSSTSLRTSSARSSTPQSNTGGCCMGDEILRSLTPDMFHTPRAG